MDYLDTFSSDEAFYALLEVENEIETTTEFCGCLAATWIRDDAPGLNHEGWRGLLTDPRVTPACIMSEAGLAKLYTLPEVIPVFRGFTRDRGEEGFAWTLDRAQAEWFAQYHGGPRMQMLYGIEPDGVPRVATGTIAKDNVIACFLERVEAEIVVLPEDVTVTCIEPVSVEEAS